MTKRKGLLSFLSPLSWVWYWLTEPSTAIPEPDRRRQARLLASLLVVLIPLGAALELITVVLADPAEPYLGYRESILWLSVLTGAYGLSRTRRYALGASLTVVIVSIAIFTREFLEGAKYADYFYYLILPLLFGSLFLPSRLLLPLAIADVLGMMLFPFIFPHLTYADLLTGPASFFFFVAALFLLATWHRDQLERDRQAQLSRERKLLRTVIDNLPDDIYAKDAQGRFILNNVAGVQSRGATSPEDVQGKTDFDFYARELAEQYDAYDQAVMRSGQPLTREEPAMDPAGGQRWVLTTRVPLRDSDGQALGIVAIGREITERKRMEEALRESEIRHRTLIEQIPAITYLDAADPASPRGYAPVYVSPQFERLLGYSPDEYRADSDLWYGIIHPDDRARVKAEDAGHFTTGQPSSQEYRLIARDGRVLWFRDDCVQRRDEAGQRLLTQGLLLDITERKQHERELEAIAAVSTALRAAQTRAEMLPIILDQLLDLLKVEGAALALRDPVTGEAVIELARGVWAHHTGLRLPPDEKISGRIIAIGQPYVNNDVRGDLFSTLSDLVNGFHAVAGAPLIAQKQTTGALWIGRGQSGRSALYAEITPDDLRLLTAIADIAANAIHRVTLHEQTERRLRHVQALHANDRAITASLDLRLTLTILLEQVTAQLGVDAAAVLLLHASTQTLEYAAGRGFRTPVIQRTRRRLGEGHAGRAALEKRIISLPDIGQTQEPFERAALMTGDLFTAYFAAPLIAKGQVKGVLEIFHRRPLAPDTEWLDFLDAVAGQAAIAIDNATLFEDLQRSNTELALAYDTTLEGWSRALDLRDKETEGHTQRVTEMTLRLASAMGAFSEAQLVHLRRGALLHDIGKMGIPDSILLKPGPLTEEEWVVMRRHPGHAYDMLSPIAFLRPALDIPLCHHEKWDGSGYPRGLKGDDIPLAARLFAVVDVWDALCSDRPYRQGWPEDKVREHIRALAGTHFDPQVVEAFLRLLNGSSG